MASYFNFIPSNIQERVLRYALSRLELVDTDELQLDRLGIVWGKRSIVELRDVGLKIKVVDIYSPRTTPGLTCLIENHNSPAPS